MLVNKHIWNNHILFKKNKSRFYNEETAVRVITKILEVDQSTTVCRGNLGRLVLMRKFPYSIRVDSKNTELFVGKVVLGVSGDVITSFPTERIRYGYLVLTLFSSLLSYMQVKARGHITEKHAFRHVRPAKTMIILPSSLIRVSVYFGTCLKA